MGKVGQTGVPMVDIPCFVGIDGAKDLLARPGGPTLKKIPVLCSYLAVRRESGMEECGNPSGIQGPASWPMQEAARPTLPSSGHATHPTPRLALRWHHRGPPRGAVFQRALARLACWDVVPGLCFRLLGVFARPHWLPHSRLPGGHLLSVPCRISGPCRSMTRLWPCDQP